MREQTITSYKSIVVINDFGRVSVQSLYFRYVCGDAVWFKHTDETDQRPIIDFNYQIQHVAKKIITVYYTRFF